ncbi:MAG: hypothetical protein JWQ87_1858 [Candidatus Sulfotelmatobacter sp.]|nr:hypothetical protein [Candidatus Sulfotelmatobacter sp.]
MASHLAQLSIDQSAFHRSDAALLDHFLEAERAASQKYRDAYLLDVPHERFKNRLIALVQEFGIPDAGGSKRTLRVRDFELTVTLALSNRIDHIAVKDFRYALIKDGRAAHGIAADLFEGLMVYAIRPCAREALSGMRLSGNLRELLDKCEIVSGAPILDLSRIIPE